MGVLRQTHKPLEFIAIQVSTQMLSTFLHDTGEMKTFSLTLKAANKINSNNKPERKLPLQRLDLLTINWEIVAIGRL